MRNKVLLKILLFTVFFVLGCAVLLSGCSESSDDGSLSADDKIIQETIFEDGFDNLSETEQIEKVEADLNELAQQGIIDGDSIKYYESQKMFTYKYTDGVLGGVSLKEFNDEYNGLGAINSQKLLEISGTSAKTGDVISAIVFNGFENTTYRRSYYESLKTDWDNKGLSTTIDTEITVDDIKNMGEYDVVVFAMHGTEYGNSPSLCINEAVTAKKDKHYKYELENEMIAKVGYSDGDMGYLVLPAFFNGAFDQDELKNDIIYSESCMFFGCDCYSVKPDYSLASAIEYASTATVVGYHNSVGADYSRDVMKQTIDNMLLGYDVNHSLELAKDIFGDDDDWEKPDDDKYKAYPLIYGDGNITIVDVSVTDFSIESEKTIALGQIDIIEPIFEPETANDYEITWTSSNENIAVISQDGIITPKQKGKTTITATVTSKGNTITRTTELTVSNQGRDTVLVLDVSGSMSGEPLEEMKKSAINFCNELLQDAYNNRVGIVFYDSSIETINLTNDLNYLIDCIDLAYSGSTTNMIGALNAAEDMLDNYGENYNIENIIVMADGLPNEGATSSSGSFKYNSNMSYYSSDGYANAVVDAANRIMTKYNMYSLGFFHDLYDDEFDYANALMSSLTNMTDGYHQVEQAENLQFAFGDIQQTISDGSKIVINIACPVDVTVKYNNETLCSNERNFSDTASFGRLKLLGRNKDIKVLALDPDIDYDIELTGTGVGTMNYSVNYFDDNENIVDYRIFEEVPISQTTIINSNTFNDSAMTLNIDKDSDGEVDEIWSADTKSNAVVSYKDEAKSESQPDPEKKEIESWQIILVVCISAFVMIMLIIVISLTVKNSKKTIDNKAENEPNIEFNPNFIPGANGDTEPLKHQNPQQEHIFQLYIPSKGYNVNYSVNPGQVYNVGKDTAWADIVLPANLNKISRKHCIISYDNSRKQFVINDVSTNGLRLSNDIKLNKGVNYISTGTTVFFPEHSCSVRFIK